MTGATLLAIDTSTECLALAVITPGGIFGVNSIGGAQASAQLLPQAAALLRQAGVDWGDLDAVAFGQGPGAFTGLRTSCAVAQGLAFGLGRPVLAIDSLLIVAEDAWAQTTMNRHAPLDSLDVLVAMDARMDEAYAARYARDAAGWRTLSPAALFTLAGLGLWSAAAVQQGTAPACLAGTAAAAFGSRWSAPQGWQQRPKEFDRAAALARLAVVAWQSGTALQAAEALPLYLRDRVALTTDERDAARQRLVANNTEPRPS